MALHCDATLLVARHGEASEVHQGPPGDSSGWLTQRGVEKTVALARALAGRRVASVYTSTMPAAVASGATASEVLGVAGHAIQGLDELGVGDLRDGASEEVEQEVLARFEDALQEIADLHRGETVLVFSHADVMSFCLPRLGGCAGEGLQGRRPMAHCAVAEVAVGDDGVRVLGWPGTGGLPPDEHEG
jgi:broad specificity phosphatase PhoE